ncbi:MAG: UvrD-helicase domain-containing protein, partial [Armatimonadetes bacterium]|nr:UvrD-helicase domain-containing protein [Akkermansiaceae bacterium]
MSGQTNADEDGRGVGMDILKKNLLVLASAGSGKTFCLSDRIIGLLAGGVEPERIVALTFTKKAAGEFADALLQKLAAAAEDAQVAAELEGKFQGQAVDFPELLEKVVRKLPLLTLGTMDGFFAKVLRGFQYELGVTGGKFELLDGEVAEGVRDELLEGLLDGELEGYGDMPDEEEFVAIFRRATAGREETRVLEELRGFIAVWHGLFFSAEEREWGPGWLAGVEMGEWEESKGELIEQVEGYWEEMGVKDKRQLKSFGRMMEDFRRHTLGSGVLGEAGGMVPKLMAAAGTGCGSMEISHYKPLEFTGWAAAGLRELAMLAARCELAAAASRTQAIHGLIGAYDKLVERELRARGRLGFADVKRLMGGWMKGEEARLRREAVDFRLDANYRHWLLDEFQDTSRDEWNALLPLVDEGLADEEASVFIVGDKKQAIYAWRGGEVGLFDELMDHYGAGLGVETMAESWRSCPEVLRLVNLVCGNVRTMRRMFGAAAEDWQWEDHFSAAPLTLPEKAGYARVEVVAKDEKMGLVIDLLKRIGAGGKGFSCGILVATNAHVRTWADGLRGAGFQVVEEGAREPGKDHPVGVVIWHLLRWLANPADSFATEVVMMSPLKAVLEGNYGAAREAMWEGLGGRISEVGFAGMVSEVISTSASQRRLPTTAVTTAATTSAPQLQLPTTQAQSSRRSVAAQSAERHHNPHEESSNPPASGPSVRTRSQTVAPTPLQRQTTGKR